MDHVIRAAEIWTPDRDGYLLELDDGLYGDSIEFEAVSRALVFGRGEGLPGRVWEDGVPIHLSTLDGAHFRRAKAARNAGLAAALALPFFVDRRLAAVAVLFIGDASRAIAVTFDDGGVPADEPSTTLPASGLDGDRSFVIAAPPSRVARSIARWTLDDASGAPVRHDDEASSSHAEVDEPMLLEAFATGIPRIAATPSPTIALPVVRDGATSAVLTLSI